MHIIIIAYPLWFHSGLMMTSALIYHVMNFFHLTIDVRNVCVFLAPLFSSFTTIVTFFFTRELKVCLSSTHNLLNNFLSFKKIWSEVFIFSCSLLMNITLRLPAYIQFPFPTFRTLVQVLLQQQCCPLSQDTSQDLWLAHTIMKVLLSSVCCLPMLCGSNLSRLGQSFGELSVLWPTFTW